VAEAETGVRIIDEGKSGEDDFDGKEGDNTCVLPLGREELEGVRERVLGGRGRCVVVSSRVDKA
jgi:hypothetical protein